jgi:hypothetical protein
MDEMDPKPKSDRSHPADADRAAGTPEARAPSDVMLVHGVSEDGKALAVLRARNNTLEAGVVRALGEGEPIEGEVVKLKPRPECPVLCDVEVSVPRGALTAKGGSDARTPARAGGAEPRRSGPAQVATARYRDNWDAIWQRKPGKDELPN